MTPNEMNRLCAEGLGWTYWSHGDIHIHGELCAPGEVTEDGKAFCNMYGKTQQPLQTMPTRFDAKVPDFLHSEEVNAMLLDTLLAKGCRVQMDGGGISIWDNNFNQLCHWSDTMKGPDRGDRKTAIVLAFIAWLKLKSKDAI